MKIGIIGAGFTGLAAAHTLQKLGHTVTIFERDALQDTLLRTNLPVRYLKKLQTFTGISKRELDQELKEREAFLLDLCKRNVHEISAVSQEMHSYAIKKRES